MFRTVAPTSLLERRITTLVALLPGVRDGSAEAIHDARVATRRAREALVAGQGGHDPDRFSAVAATLKHAGRALGRVRDPDVVHELLTALEARFPAAAEVTSPLRGAILQDRELGRRRLIKTLEFLDIAALPVQLRRARLPKSMLRGGGAAWRSILRDHLTLRSNELRTAVQHGSGVYFPNRSHATRIKAKKLRYAVELARELHLSDPGRVLRVLKKGQETLGEIRDRQVLIQRLDAVARTADRGMFEATVGVLEAEIRAIHQKFVAMRQDILDACDRVDLALQRGRGGAGLVAASVVIPSLALLGQRLSARRSPMAVAPAPAAQRAPAAPPVQPERVERRLYVREPALERG